MYRNTKALLFDAGHTLVYPKTGNWFIPPKYSNFFEGRVISLASLGEINDSYGKAYTFMQNNHIVTTEEEEYEHFAEFYRLLFDDLGIPQDNGITSDIAKEMVYNSERFCMYDDVPEYLESFASNFSMAVVSDTWPSLIRVFHDLGIGDYFSNYTVSSILGVCKPHSLMYTSPLKALSVQPEETVFVDDLPSHIDGAHKLGINGIVINRKTREIPTDKFPCIFGLDELEQYIS